ncbi:substrate-binding domain-containing protein, partial [Chloroflexota bacterium]
MIENNNHNQKRPTIGFFNTYIGPEWASWPWQGMVDAARKYDVNLLAFIGRIMGSPMNFDEQANILYDLAKGGHLDGLIIWKAGVMALTETEIESFCKGYDVPVVTLEGEVKGWPRVVYGNYQGMRLAVEHLIEVHGYRRIGFVGMHEHHIGFQERYRAYTDVLTTHSLPVDPKLAKPWFPDDVLLMPDGHVVEDILNSWLQEALTAGVEALVGVCDTSTIQVLKMLQAMGVDVPREVTLVSFDDFTESRVITPPLTTVMPSWHEFGYRAVETLMGMMKGQPAPEQVIISPHLMVRQSCGCLDLEVTQAAVGSVQSTTEIQREKATFNQQEVVQVMIQATRTSTVKRIHQRVEYLVESFKTDVNGKTTETFLRELDSILRQIVVVEGDISAWHKAISVLRRQALPWLGEEEMSTRAEDLWQQAQVMIGKMAERVRAYQQLQAEHRANRLHEIGQALITTFDVDGLMNVLAEWLPKLGIPSCYLSLYENPQPYKFLNPAPQWSRLVLAYNEHGRVALEPEGWQFPSGQLAPTQLWPQDRAYSFVVKPFYFQDDQIGFALFEVGQHDDMIYPTLRGQISSALKGALLVAQEEKRARQLQTVAEVGTAASTILDIDKLLQAVVDLTKTRFELYHVHLYLLNEAQDTLVLKAGAGEKGHQMVTQGWSLSLAAEKSLVIRAAQNRQGEIVNNVQANPHWLPNSLLPDTRSELAVPLIVGDQLLGVLDVQADEVDYFTEEDVHIQGTLATQIAVAIQNARLYHQEAERAQELAKVNADLKAAQDELIRQERLATVGQMTAIVSHEIRNPLATIRASAFMIDKKTRDKGFGIERALDRLDRNITRCDNIIAEFLDYTRMPG